MQDDVKRSSYVSHKRAERAANTRRAVLAAARRLFESEGYEGTAMARIAEEAGVAVDTVYAVVGRKPELLLAVIDMTLARSDEPVPAEDRDYVRAIGAAATAEGKIRVYAAALGELLPRTAPLLDALRQAASSDSECRTAWEYLDDRRAVNMRLFAAQLRATGRLRTDLSDDEVADIVWSTNSVQYFMLLRQRRWSAGRFADLLADLWMRTLLESPSR